MLLACIKASVRSSAARWCLDALVADRDGKPIPCFVSVVSAVDRLVEPFGPCAVAAR
jgi:hypothetical protein